LEKGRLQKVYLIILLDVRRIFNTIKIQISIIITYFESFNFCSFPDEMQNE